MSGKLHGCGIGAICRPLANFSNPNGIATSARVARHELPWVAAGKVPNPNGVAPRRPTL